MSPAAGHDEDGDAVVVGRIGPAHGVDGAVFVEPRTDAPEQRFVPGAVLGREAPGGPALTVESVGRSGGRLVVRFAGIADRDTAQTLRGTRLTVPAAQRAPLGDPDEFYDTDLVGLEARTPDGTVLGPVRRVVHAAGATDYLLVEVGGRDRMVPFVRAIVPHVDLAAGTVTVDAPQGLFEL